MSSDIPSLPSIESVNSMSTAEELISVTNVLFESTFALTSKLLQRKPFKSYTDLINAAQDILLPQSNTSNTTNTTNTTAPSNSSSQLSESEIIEILNAHPRIGAPKQSLSALSVREQGLGSNTTTQPPVVDEATLTELAQLNEQYEKKYGFKFVIFVNGRSRAALLPEFRERLQNGTRENEIKTGLQAMIDIARDRLSKLKILDGKSKM